MKLSLREARAAGEKIRAVFFDMDGTLMSHSISDVPPSARRALQLLHAQGTLLFLCTGRHRAELARLPLYDFPFDGYVTMTGHLCYDARWRPIFRMPFPSQAQAALAEAFRARQLPLVLVNEGGLYINFLNDRVEQLLQGVSTAPPREGTYQGEAIYGAVTFCDQAQADGLIRSLPGCRLSRWHPNGFDIISQQTGKAHGMEEIMKRFHLAREEVMAFGDGDNDAEMLSFAGIGVAVGNGTDKAKESADYVAGPIDEDGIWNAFRDLGILRMEQGEK